MGDGYFRAASSGPGRAVLHRLSLPVPVPLVRYRPGAPLVSGPVAVLEAPGARAAPAVRSILDDAGVPRAGSGDAHAAIVLDATGLSSSSELSAVPELVGPLLHGLRPHGRVVVLGSPPGTAGSTDAAVAQRALEGVTRSLGKEVRAGATCNLVQFEAGAESAAESTLRFLLSARSAYVSGQVVRVEAASATPAPDWNRPLNGAVALVTGAAQGIGAAIADVLARDGAHVVCVDTPGQTDTLRAVATRVGGSSLTIDLTDDSAPERIAGHLNDRHGGVDVVVHNAGITRDRTLARMDSEQWSSVVSVNLQAVERLTGTFLDRNLIRPGGSVVVMSSMNAIAGSRGQTNYAASKAGLIGFVEALAPELRTRDLRINAAAPGFIETRMTARMPAALRTAGRLLNSLGQGGQPVDVAETVAWLAAPSTAGVTGQTVRVCGQAVPGA